MPESPLATQRVHEDEGSRNDDTEALRTRILRQSFQFHALVNEVGDLCPKGNESPSEFVLEQAKEGLGKVTSLKSAAVVVLLDVRGLEVEVLLDETGPELGVYSRQCPLKGGWRLRSTSSEFCSTLLTQTSRSAVLSSCREHGGDGHRMVSIRP
jgi:hypothetical protein